MEVAQQFQDSEAVKEAIAKAQEAADIGMQKATQAAEDLKKSEVVQKTLSQATLAAEQAAEKIQSSESVRTALTQAQQAAEVGLTQAQQAAEAGMARVGSSSKDLQK